METIVPRMATEVNTNSAPSGLKLRLKFGGSAVPASNDSEDPRATSSPSSSMSLTSQSTSPNVDALSLLATAADSAEAHQPPPRPMSDLGK